MPQNSGKMRTIFMTCQLGQEIRDFMVGDFYDLAKADPRLRLIVFVPQDKIEGCQKAFTHERCTIEPLVDLRQEKRKLKLMFRVAAWASIQSETQYIRHRYGFLNGGSFLNFIGKRLIWFLGHTYFGRALFRFIEFHLFRDEKVWRPYFEKYQPDVVFTPGGYREVDFTLIKYSRRHGVPSVGMIRSWDNFSSKARMRVLPDLLLVQNPIMAEEAVYWNDIPRERVRVVGFPSYDYYQDPSWHISKEEVAKIIGADPSKRWILYFTGPLLTGALMGQDNGEHIKMLHNARQRGEFGDAEIIASLHPSNRSVLDEKEVNCKVLNMAKGWNFDKDRMRTLANVIRHCDVTMNFGSTISLDAAILDKPIVFMGFNGYKDHEVPWQKKLSVGLEHTTHIQYFTHTGGGWRISNESEFVNAVKTYLFNPTLHSEGRKRMVKEIVGPLGGAGKRVFEIVTSMIDRSDELLPKTGIRHTSRKVKDAMRTYYSVYPR